MARQRRNMVALDDRGPLRVMFLATWLPVGGAETLLLNLIRRLDRDQFLPSACCLKSLGPVGEELSGEINVDHGLLHHKLDLRVLGRLTRLMSRRKIDVVVTVGAGDKMFWGRLAARAAHVPVVLSAIHSTGWPDSIGRLNRLKLLTRWTDGFVAVADEHARHLVEIEHFPENKVFVIPNGVDVERFRPSSSVAAEVRTELGLAPSQPVVGIVAALRPEKNHELFLRSAAQIRSMHGDVHFLVVGDGPERAALERLAGELRLGDAVRFLGVRDDIPRLLQAMDVFALTSHMEANPVSILEAMAAGKPVVAPAVGSIAESVADGRTGYVTPPGEIAPLIQRVSHLLENRALARQFGVAGRTTVIERWSLERMVDGYQALMAHLYMLKYEQQRATVGEPTWQVEPPVSGAKIH
jgi:glycosyltransferase involved in cell wall biosynthesis